MPHNVVLSGQTDFEGWRVAARKLAVADVPPRDVVWSFEETPDLFGSGEALPEEGAAFNVPRSFVTLAASAILHRDPERFALLYRILWRLRREPELMALAMDRDIARARAMAKNVGRDIHKMHAFVRFREAQTESGVHMVAWFEPQHYTLEAGSEFFTRRFVNMPWSILSPEVSSHWDGKALAMGPGVGRQAAPSEDEMEEVWRTYYASIFNPARLKVNAMRSEMPVKYWRNLPEAPLIAPLIQSARTRTEAMVAGAVTQPKPNRQREIAPPLEVRAQPQDAFASLSEELRACRYCPLWQPATQAVCGEGPVDAEIMFVGEQPGDKEDLAGRPFVGPAGKVFDQAMQDAGLDRARAYITNAVKHFKFTPRGKMRLHQKPGLTEISACRPWLDRELSMVRPKLVVALGATAVHSLLGKSSPIGKLRGAPIMLGDLHVLVTVHPSYLLRLPDEQRKREEYGRFVEDLRRAGQLVANSARRDAA